MEWSLHTLRHTVESHLRDLEIEEEVRDLVLNHVRKSSGDQYSHGRALEMKRKGLAAWHEYLLDAVDAEIAVPVNKASNVVRIGSAG